MIYSHNSILPEELEDEMRVSNSPMGCPTEISPVLISVSPKTWLDWALEHQAVKAAAG